MMGLLVSWVWSVWGPGANKGQREVINAQVDTAIQKTLDSNLHE